MRGKVQWILIIQIFRISEFSDLLQCMCNPQVSIHSIFTVICGHAQSSKKFESPNTQVPSWGQSKEMLGFLVPALRLYIHMYPSCGLFSALLLCFPFFINHLKNIRTILSSETKLIEKQALSWLWLMGYSLLTWSRIMVPKGQKDTKCPCNWILTWAMNLIGEIVCPPKRRGSWGSSPPPIPHRWRVATHTYTHALTHSHTHSSHLFCTLSAVHILEPENAFRQKEMRRRHHLETANDLLGTLMSMGGPQSVWGLSKVCCSYHRGPCEVIWCGIKPWR